MNPARPSAKIQILNRQRRYRIRRRAVAEFCSEALRVLGRPNEVLSVVFVGAREMRSLNRRFLARDYATDVLSFGYGEPAVEGGPLLGEVVVAPQVAVQQAARYGTDPQRELAGLLIHGILHLLDYDHEKDRGRMRRVQTRLMRRRFFAAARALADLKERR